MDFFDDIDIELATPPTTSSINESVNVSISQPSLSESANINISQPIQVNTGESEPAATNYSLGEKYRSAFSAAKSPEEYDAQVEMFKAELNAQQSALPNLGIFASDTPLIDKNDLLKSLTSDSFSVNPEITRSITDNVQYKIDTNLGPMSIVRVPSVLTDWEKDNGYYLQPDKFGIYRKFKNGIMNADDAYKVSILDGAYDKAVHDAFTELLASNIDVLPKSEVQGKSTTVPPATTSNPSMDIKTDSSYGPGLSDAMKQGLVLDSMGRVVVGSGGNNGSDLVYRGGNVQAQFTSDNNWTIEHIKQYIISKGKEQITNTIKGFIEAGVMPAPDDMKHDYYFVIGGASLPLKFVTGSVGYIVDKTGNVYVLGEVDGGFAVSTPITTTVGFGDFKAPKGDPNEYINAIEGWSFGGGGASGVQVTGSISPSGVVSTEVSGTSAAGVTLLSGRRAYYLFNLKEGAENFV